MFTAAGGEGVGDKISYGDGPGFWNTGTRPTDMSLKLAAQSLRWKLARQRPWTTPPWRLRLSRIKSVNAADTLLEALVRCCAAGPAGGAGLDMTQNRAATRKTGLRGTCPPRGLRGGQRSVSKAFRSFVKSIVSCLSV